MAKGFKETGDPKRMVDCNFCGGQHRRRSKEMRECRQRYRHGKQPSLPQEPPQPPQPATKPKVRLVARSGNPREHLVVRRAKDNWPVRKIAKQMDLPVGEVKRILKEAR